MPVNPWSSIAPIGPYANSYDRLPAARRTPSALMLSRVSGHQLLSRADSLKGVANSPGTIVISHRKLASPPRTVEAWFPAGAEVMWGEGAPVTAPSDGRLQFTYSAPGTYQVIANNVAQKKYGSKLITV